jgi:enoyl-[acyl-carrier-protein] reductase (NADH)
MEEKIELPMVVGKDSNGYLYVENYEGLKAVITKKLEEYKVFVCQTSDDYKATKDTRAELNKLAKVINDTKIKYVKDATQTLTTQCKELCSLIEDKALEFDTEAKKYEIEQLNKEVKIKQGSFDIAIHCNNKEELERIKKVLDTKKFIKYSIKENN